MAMLILCFFQIVMYPREYFFLSWSPACLEYLFHFLMFLGPTFLFIEGRLA